MNPMPAPTVGELLTELRPTPERLSRLLGLARGPDGVSPGGKYRHWDTLRHLSPPQGLSHKEWWLAIKLARGSSARPLPLVDSDGQPFLYSTPDEAQALLHLVDQRASGEVSMPEAVAESEGAKARYLVNSLIEEAIRSSQLEGAATSRRVAAEMLRSGRQPRNRSERMIANNYRALEFIRQDLGDRLSPDAVLELHRIVTDGTLEDPSAAGRIQGPEEHRVAVWNADGSLAHRPPPAEQLPQRMELMCAFANSEVESPGFMHPVLRAIVLHFWLGHDHPFEDGNGRTARALFYWSMRRQGYWLTEYLSISRILRSAPGRYARAFQYTESDDRDTTYFILFHLSVIRRAIDELYSYLTRKADEVRSLERGLRASDAYNYRQLALLSDALRHPAHEYTFRSHARSHRVVYQSARNDLLDLRRRGLLEMRRVGRQHVFRPAPDLAERLQDSGGPQGRAGPA